MSKALFVTAIVVGALDLFAVAAQPERPRAVFTEAQAATGKAAYESVCFNCHTYALTGRKGDPAELPTVDSLTEPYRKSVQDGIGKIPALAGEAFVKRWAGRTTQALSTRITTAIGGFPPAGLDANTANNLAAYFLKVSGAPAGTQELGTPATTEVLIRETMPSGAAAR